MSEKIYLHGWSPEDALAEPNFETRRDVIALAKTKLAYAWAGGDTSPEVIIYKLVEVDRIGLTPKFSSTSNLASEEDLVAPFNNGTLPDDEEDDDEFDATAQPLTPASGAEASGEVAIPEGFKSWNGGDCPLPLGTHAEVLTRRCDVWPIIVKAEAPLLWVHENHDLDIIAYRIIEAQPSAPLDQAAEQTTDELEGGKPEAGLQEFMQRPGAVRVEENMMIEGGVEDRHWLYESGYIFTGKDPILIWRSDNDHGTIVAYAPAEAPTPKPTETESETHVLDAEPSPVLRSDLSPSTETFTAPSGDEFAKHNGETRLIVSDALEAA